MIKAIETVYDGYKFRSRLEARWAVFFKNAGIKYLYENEGYQLPSGWYLPDFYLPEMNLFVEVKPKEPTDKEKQLMVELVTFTQTRGMFALQIPTNPIDMYECSKEVGYFGMWCGNINHETKEKGCGGDNPYLFCQCLSCGVIGFEWEGHVDRVKNHGRNCLNDTDYTDAINSPTLTKAYIKAKQARFEHGECG